MNLEQATSLGQALEHALLENPQNIGLLEYNRERLSEKLTYREIYDGAVHVCRLLQHQGLTSSRHCGIIMSNQSKWNISAIGVFFAGAVLVPIDYKLGPVEQASLIQHAQLHTLIIEYPIWMRMIKEGIDTQLKDVVVIVTEAPKNQNIAHGLSWDTATDSFEHNIIHPGPTDTATIVYSSGTFGKAKGCMLTHQNYISQASALAKLFPVDQRHTYFSFIPTNHAIDFMCGFFLPLVSQSKTVHQRTLRPEFIASTIKDASVTHMALVPLLLKNLYVKISSQIDELSWPKKIFIRSMKALNALMTKHRPRYKLSRLLLYPIHKKFGGHLQYIFVGGAFADQEIIQYFYDLGFSVSVGYGLTEAGTVLSVNDFKPFKSHTVGPPLPITKLEIRNVQPTGIGEVWAHGPTVMKGYYQDDELTSQTVQDGWLQTGDLGYFEDGHLILKGRHKNMIVTSGGKNVYPEDIEPYFQKTPLEEYCVLAGNFLFSEQEDLRDQLFLVARPEPAQDMDKCISHIQQANRELPEYKRLSGVVLWDRDFPKTATMKVKRPLLAQEIAHAKESLTIRQL